MVEGRGLGVTVEGDGRRAGLKAKLKARAGQAGAMAHLFELACNCAIGLSGLDLVPDYNLSTRLRRVPSPGDRRRPTKGCTGARAWCSTW